MGALAGQRSLPKYNRFRTVTGGADLWKYVDSCVRGELPFFECTSVFEFGGICVALLLAVVALIVLIVQRTLEDERK